MTTLKKLKKVRAYRSNLTTFNGEQDNSYLFYERQLTPDNRPIHITYYDKNGEERLVESFKYDEKGNLIEEINNHIDEERLEMNTWKYDDAGNLIEECEYYEDELFEKTIHNYNSLNQKISTSHLDSDDNVLDNNTFEYNDHGKLLKHNHFDEQGTLDWSLDLEYDAQGNVIKETKHNYLEKTSEITIHNFDLQGNRLDSTSQTDQGEVLSILEEEYDDAGNHVETVAKSKYPYVSHTIRTTEYDEQGRATANQLFDEMNNYLLSREIIEYDEDGHPSSQEIYELRTGQGMIKTHFMLTFDNEYWD